MDSTVTIIGNITRDPELRHTPSGQRNATFGVAVNRRWRDQQTQDWKEQVSFFDVVCWRDLADNAYESLTKGARVIVTGRLDQRSWDDAQGNRRSKVEIVADEVGPSLRWATADIAKNQTRAPEPAMAGAAADQETSDEEPF